MCPEKRKKRTPDLSFVEIEDEFATDIDSESEASEKDEGSSDSDAVDDFERMYKIFQRRKKNRKKLTQQRNTDFHTSIFCHQKKTEFPPYTGVLSCATMPHIS